ncbi:MAG: mismatch-specific DNA-glycosylase [Xanthomonadales bacterium]|nr:mismatch-specific DNA-glycosylase [Xanthomonadales bacterium]
MAEPILPDVLQAGLRVVFCGTAPSTRSAAEHAYYAHPGNAFWRALHASGLTPRLLAPAEFTCLPKYGIGLTDLAKHHSGNDAQLPQAAFDVAALRRKITRYAPQLLAFTSKNAAQAVFGHGVAYGLQNAVIAHSKIFVLPSPSGQARRFWDITVWQALATHAAHCKGVER